MYCWYSAIPTAPPLLSFPPSLFVRRSDKKIRDLHSLLLWELKCIKMEMVLTRQQSVAVENCILNWSGLKGEKKKPISVKHFLNLRMQFFCICSTIFFSNFIYLFIFFYSFLTRFVRSSKLFLTKHLSFSPLSVFFISVIFILIFFFVIII